MIIRIRITIINMKWAGNNKLKIEDMNPKLNNKTKTKNLKCTFIKISNLMNSFKMMNQISSECFKITTVYLNISLLLN